MGTVWGQEGQEKISPADLCEGVGASRMSRASQEATGNELENKTFTWQVAVLVSEKHHKADSEEQGFGGEDVKVSRTGEIAWR